jgi:hypothetical protein
MPRACQSTSTQGLLRLQAHKRADGQLEEPAERDKASTLPLLAGEN